jgi:hypothetical protein
MSQMKGMKKLTVAGSATERGRYGTFEYWSNPKPALMLPYLLAHDENPHPCSVPDLSVK